MSPERNQKATKLAVTHYAEQARRHWPLTIPSLVLPGLGSILISYVPPLIVARILVKFNGHKSLTFKEIWPYILTFMIVWTAGEVLWRVGMWLLSKMEVKAINELYNQAMDFLFAKDLAFFHDNFAGSLTKKVVGYAKNFEGLMDTISMSVMTNVLPLFFVVFVLWRYSPWLVVALLAMVCLTVVTVKPLIQRRQKMVAAREAASNVAAGHVADVLANMDTVRAFAREDFEAEIHSKHVWDFTQKTKKAWDYHNSHIDGATSPFYILTNTVGLAIALLFTSHNTETLAVVFITFSYYSSFTRVLWDFNRIYRNIENAITEGAQFTELLLDEPRITDAPQTEKLNIGAGSIDLQHVDFKYHDSSGEHLFKDLSLSIAGGEKVALVGHSGGGKTTITRLLLRFMDIDDGRILIDGQDISMLKQADLRSAIAYVPQEPAMFHRSLADNIRYGRLDASQEEIEEAARSAHADEFIKRLSQGYDTLVGERGVKLSGGQRQRIAIARAMLKNAPVLVLDEATSALDSESEKLIQQALWKLMEGKTVIAIAHRLSTIQKMDRILVMEEGRIVEQGSHKELLAHKGIYASLWAHQSGGFLED
jgi:ATP-binding cassette subfamily B protein